MHPESTTHGPTDETQIVVAPGPLNDLGRPARGEELAFKAVQHAVEDLGLPRVQ